MILNLYRVLFVVFGCMLCCVPFAQSMESYERNQERLRAATFDFIEKYVQTRNDHPRFRIPVRPCLFQYVPERITGLAPDSWCLIPARDVDEIATAIGINAALKNFTVQYEAFQKSNLVTKRMFVSNCLYACVFASERESIRLNGQSRIDGYSADQIAEFLKIKN